MLVDMDARNEITKFIKKYAFLYPDDAQKDFEEKIFKGYTINNDIINQIYVYLKIIDFMETDYYSFIELMNDTFNLKEQQRIIEIGCGTIPILSGKTNTLFPNLQISCLDKSVLIKLSDTLEYIEQDFSSNMSISKYDLVFGFRPCGITEDIIKKCLQNNKSFIIYLCNCALKPQENYDYNENTWAASDWHNYIFYIANKYNQGNFSIKKEQLKNGYDNCPVIIGMLL